MNTNQARGDAQSMLWQLYFPHVALTRRVESEDVHEPLAVPNAAPALLARLAGAVVAALALGRRVADGGRAVAAAADPARAAAGARQVVPSRAAVVLTLGPSVRWELGPLMMQNEIWVRVLVAAEVLG